MPVNISVDSKQAKTMAKALATRLAGMGVEIGHSQALEAIAGALGFPEWNVLAARLGTNVPSENGGKSPEQEVLDFARGKGVAVLGTMHIPTEYARHAGTAEMFPNPDTFAKAVEEYALAAMGPEMAREMMWGQIVEELASGGGRGTGWYDDLIRDREAAAKPF